MTTVALIPGVVYSFKVGSRNRVGLSALSESPVSVLAATVPERVLSL